MILVDYSQVVLASLFVSIGNHTNIELNDDLIRHMTLNSLRAIRNKFKNEYGELVICCDDKHSWRRDYFPYYKASRRKTREESEIDWNDLMRIIETIRSELDENFPYKVIRVHGCEADDIIGTICHEFGTPLNMGNEKILILSGDKDFKQLLGYANVEQYDSIGKRSITVDNPSYFLMEHILKGDRGDGIPNILSPDNCLVIGERQKPMTAPRIAKFSTGPKDMDPLTRERYERNRKLIDLSQTPDEHKVEILAALAAPKDIGRRKIIPYFMAKKLRNLMENIPEF